MFFRVKLVSGPMDAEADGTTPYSFVAAGTNNATLVKAGPVKLISIHAINVNAAIRYLKFYDMAQAPTGGVGKPVRRYGIPGNTAGAGFVLQPVIPMTFVNGLAFVLVTGIADTDNTAVTANDCVITLELA